MPVLTSETHTLNAGVLYHRPCYVAMCAVW